MQLAADNKKSPRQFSIKQEGDEATVYLYDAIDPYWGTDAAAFVKEFAAITASTIHLRINSPGGDVFDARTMATAIKQHSGRVVAHIDGIAASAATYVALAADEVRIADGAFFMIHNAWTIAYGNKHDLAETAALLDKIDGSIINDYVAKTGKDREEIAALMDAETWFSAEEAVENGFADAVDTDSAKAKNQWNLAAYANAPAALLTPPDPSPDPFPTIDRAAIERRFALLESQV